MQTDKIIITNRLTGRLDQRVIGILQVLLSTIGFGAIGIFAKMAYQAGLHSPQLLALRFMVAAALLWAYFLIFKRGQVRIEMKELFICAALGVAGYGIFSTLVFKALETTSASITGLIFFSYPVFVMLIDRITVRERIGAQLWFGALLIITGILIGVFGTTSSHLSSGMFLALAGAAWYAAYVAASRHLVRNVSPQSMALYVTSFAALGFWSMGGPILPRLAEAEMLAWVAVLALALFSTVMALLSFYAGLEKLGSAQAAQIGTFELIVSLALATLVLGEKLSMPVVAGAVLILSGMVMGQLKINNRSQPCQNVT